MAVCDREQIWSAHRGEQVTGSKTEGRVRKEVPEWVSDRERPEKEREITNREMREMRFHIQYSVQTSMHLEQ